MRRASGARDPALDRPQAQPEVNGARGPRAQDAMPGVEVRQARVRGVGKGPDGR